jgi:hypothetical protein
MSGTRVITLACRTSDRLLDGCRGATTVAGLIAEAAGTEPQTVGTSSEPRIAPWGEDLTARARACSAPRGSWRTR